MAMEFEVIEKDLAGRVGRLRTRAGDVETPALFPVIDPVKNVVSVREIEEVGFKTVITNAYLIMRRYGDSARELGVKSIIDAPDDMVVMTDSGAYQLLEYGYVDVDPEQILYFQRDIGSDIGVILDIPTRYGVSKREVAREVEETIRRAVRASVLKRLGELGDMHLVGPVQGGVFLDILAYSARRMAELDFDMYALGSPTTLLKEYEYEPLIDMMYTARSHIPINKPMHLFGAGHPMMLAFAVALGYDTFDSASYALYARDNRYMTPYGTLRLENMKYLPCSCDVCRKYSVEELLEMSAQERERLLALHNLYVLKQELDAIKQAIKEGRLWEYLEIKAKTHPSLYKALLRLRKYVKFLEKLDPETLATARGIYTYPVTSRYRPEVSRHINRLLNRYSPPKKKLLVVLPAPKDRPYHNDPSFRSAFRAFVTGQMQTKVHIVFYAYPFGPIPIEIDDVYPLSQHESVGIVTFSDALHVAKLTAEYVKKFRGSYEKVIVFAPKKLVRVFKKLLGQVADVLEFKDYSDAANSLLTMLSDC